MKYTKVILVIVLVCTISRADAQKPLLDSIITIFQTRSVYAHTENWDSLRTVLYESINYSDSDRVKAIIPAYIKLSKILGILHGGLNYKGKNYGAITSGLAKMFKRIPHDLKTAARNNKFRFRTMIIENNYGYISIPPIGIKFSNNINEVKKALSEKAKILQDSLCKLNIAPLKGLIIDLRLNGGGSFVAMIGGLSDLLEDGKVFTFVMGNGEKQTVMKTNNSITFNKDTLVDIFSRCPALNRVKLAVLISPFTVSAGEQTAISLEGRKHTVFIGERTRGMTTGIQSIQLRKNLRLDVAEGYAVDRDGNVYKNGVVPDIKITGGNDFTNLLKDKKIQAALNWFRKNE